MYFSKLFTVQELGFRNPEPFIGPLIRKFLQIGEAVAGRWIEMPQGVLLFQMAPGVPDSGAIYLYDRRKQVFYMACFEGEDDHFTLEEFNQLLEEYNLIQFAEQPGLAPLRVPRSSVVANTPRGENQENRAPAFLVVSLPLRPSRPCRSFPSRPNYRPVSLPAVRQLHVQSAGSA